MRELRGVGREHRRRTLEENPVADLVIDPTTGQRDDLPGTKATALASQGQDSPKRHGVGWRRNSSLRGRPGSRDNGDGDGGAEAGRISAVPSNC